jgi:hypothetical protein
MSFGQIVDAGPWALAAFIVIVALVLSGVVVCLRVALRDTSEASRPEIIRALADLFKSMWGRK